MRQRIGILLLVLCLLAGCGVSDQNGSGTISQGSSEPRGNNSLCIGITLYGLENDYMVRFATAVADYAEEQGIELELYAGNYDASTQIRQVEQMIEDQLDGIILIPQSSADCVSCVDKAVEAGIPIISVNTRVANDRLTSYVGSNDTEAGEILLRETAKALGGRGAVAVLEGPIGQSAQVERRNGIQQELQKYEDIQVLSCKTANWSELEAQVVVQKWLNTFEELDAIIAENDSMALGAVDVAEKQGKDDLVIVGVDGSQEALEAVQQGKMQMTVFQNAEAQAETALNVIRDTIAGKPVKSAYWIPLKVVTKENVTEYLEK